MTVASLLKKAASAFTRTSSSPSPETTQPVAAPAPVVSSASAPQVAPTTTSQAARAPHAPSRRSGPGASPQGQREGPRNGEPNGNRNAPRNNQARNGGRSAPPRAAAPNSPNTRAPAQNNFASAAAQMSAKPAQTAPQVQVDIATDEGFGALGLRPELVRAVLEHGYTKPTPIQTQAIPVVLRGGDVLGGAQTGTGKTAGFVLPLLQRLLENPVTKSKLAPRVLVLAPTRELAAQVEESVQVYGKHTNITSTVIFGGVGMPQQVAAVRKGVDVVVATPGRLLDHHGQRTIDLSKVEILVLDEADRMLDMGFIHDIKKILAIMPPKRQNLLFSATFSDEIKALADRLLNAPTLIEVARRNSTIEVVEQSIVKAEKSQKSKLLQRLVTERNWTQVLVFTRTKHGANRLAEQLTKADIPALAIHGNKSQGARTRALAEFKSGSLQVLVATDIAARGIDIDQLPQVVNYELPNVPEDYVHRIGRTGRAGATGMALSLVSRDEMPFLKDIERLIKQQIPVIEIEGFKQGEREAGLDDDDRPPLPPGRGRRGSPNAHQQKRSENTRNANQQRNTRIATATAAMSGGGAGGGNAGRPAPRTPADFNIGNRNTSRGRTR
jgi:ATP-dependent RNA helicase RhlE